MELTFEKFKKYLNEIEDSILSHRRFYRKPSEMAKSAVITGKMFGYGIYYAPKARKSLGYTSLSGSYWANGSSSSGFMALMDVAYGKPYDVHSFDSKYYNFNYDALQRACPGANCLHAHEGSMLRNDEIIVYKEEQCTIKYLVELKKLKII